MTEDRKKVSTEQLRLLVEEIEKDPTLLNHRSTGHAPKQEYLKKWSSLARKLNSVDNGTLKNVFKWQQSLRDWKSNTRRKAIKIKNIRSCQNDVNQELTTLEVRLLNLYDEDLPLVKSNGIDISSIVEVDSPLDHSVYDTENGHSWNKEIWAEHLSNEFASLKSLVRCLVDNDKSKEIEALLKSAEDILTRITDLEATQQETDIQYFKVLIETMRNEFVEELQRSKARVAQNEAILKILEKGANIL